MAPAVAGTHKSDDGAGKDEKVKLAVPDPRQQAMRRGAAANCASR